MYFLGCPMWANQSWQGSLYHANKTNSVVPVKNTANTFLSQYSSYFNTVEGNTTFYADPTPETVARWLAQVSHQQSDAATAPLHAYPFQFAFKVPQRISHQGAGIQALADWLTLIAPLQHHIGYIHFQLSAQFTPAQLTTIAPLLQMIRAKFACAVEIRHPAFFDKAQHEQALHQLLRGEGCERVCFDSRALFSVPATTASLQDAQRKKPRLPVHAVALTTKPMFRFIGLDCLASNRHFYQPWLTKMLAWCQQGATPYAFFHTPDNRLAPLLAKQFATDLHALGGPWHPILQDWPTTESHSNPQFSLFSTD